MPNTKTFKVTSEIKIRRPIWRFLGLGDQPSKAEVEKFFHDIAVSASEDSGIVPQVQVRYLGSPGYYLVEVEFTAAQPFWRRLGFGDMVSKQEVRWHFLDSIDTAAVIESLEVEILK